MKYEETINIPKSEYERINRLLAIESLEEMTDEQLRAVGANTDVHEGVYGVTFEDGCMLRYDLCSGFSNYWDDVLFVNGESEYVPECTFELDDFELKINENTYVVHLNIQPG